MRRAGFASLFIAAVLALSANGEMESLVVPAGETLTVTASATYDTVTVNGTLIVSAGTLTATNAGGKDLRLREEDGKLMLELLPGGMTVFLR